MGFLDKKRYILIKDNALYRIFTGKEDKTRVFYLKTEKVFFEGAGYMEVTAPIVFKEK